MDHLRSSFIDLSELDKRFKGELISSMITSEMGVGGTVVSL